MSESAQRERAPAEPRAREGEDCDQLYRELVRDLPGAIYTCDGQGRIRLYNRAAVELWGREPTVGVDQWCGSSKIFTPKGAPVAPDACPMAVALKEGRAVRGVEIVVGRPDRTRRNVLPFPSPIRDASGKVVGAVNMLVDITEQKAAESQLAAVKDQLAQIIRESEQQFRTLAQHAPVGIYLTDASGDCQFVNDMWCRMTGLSLGEAGGRGWVRALHPEDRDGVAAEWYACAQQRKPFAGEYRYLRPDGVVTWLQASAVEFCNTDGKVAGHIGSVVDITARKQAEFALKEAKEQAEAANRSKDRFLAVLSHELRTPLTPVLMSVAARLMDPSISAELREELTMIRRNVELETKLIDDLLDLSRITSGKLALRPQVVDLNDAVRHVCTICRDQIFEKSIKLRCELDPAAGEVTADAARLQQVLWNVLKNAAKFTPDGGQIDLATQRVAGDRVAIRVRDTGSGIAPEMLPRVFDAFEQGDPRISRQFGGLGLGLAITKSLVELHRGTIRAESDGPNRGSVFTIEFPARPAPLVGRAGDRRSPDAAQNRLRLLIVEDHADTAMVLGKLLSASGYHVKTAGCAERAMQMIEQEPFDLLISDIGLPDSNGYELMKRIRAAHAIRGIAMSGFGMDEDIRKSREAGFSDHLVKPVNVAQLHDVIRRVSATAPKV